MLVFGHHGLDCRDRDVFVETLSGRGGAGRRGFEDQLLHEAKGPD